MLKLELPSDPWFSHKLRSGFCQVDICIKILLLSVMTVARKITHQVGVKYPTTEFQQNDVMTILFLMFIPLVSYTYDNKSLLIMYLMSHLKRGNFSKISIANQFVSGLSQKNSQIKVGLQLACNILWQWISETGTLLSDMESK